MFADQAPTRERPVRIYVSSTLEDRTRMAITHQGWAIGWEDQTEISPERRATIVRQLRKNQPGEVEWYENVSDKGRNIVTVIGLEELESVLQIASLIKAADGAPYNENASLGRWSRVFAEPVVPDNLWGCGRCRGKRVV